MAFFQALPQVPAMPPGQTDQNAWNVAFHNGWIVDKSQPLTQLSFPDKVVMSPPCDKGKAYTFSRRMLAFPLTQNGPPGSVPDGKADWWVNYFNVNTLGYAKRAWVQGHLLNHNVHGPGVAENLVPMTDALNRIMEKWAESVIKAEVDKGKILFYEVTVHWLAGSPSSASHDWIGGAQRHANDMCKNLDGHKTGECLAPTSVSWSAFEIAWDGKQWVKGLPLVFRGLQGIENFSYANSFNQ